MDFGIVMSTATRSARQGWAARVEERGFDSLFYPEHTHIPVRRQAG